MFLGHFAVGLAAVRAAPRVSLGALFLASQLADLIWPNLVLLGIERVEIDPGNTAVTPLNFVAYPYIHSLAALALWAACAGLLYALTAQSAVRAAWIVGAVVLSHWFLDAMVHRPDLPLTVTGETRVGLGLWNSLPITVLLEFALFGAGVALYARGTRARDRIGSIGFVALILCLALIYAANLLGPPPPSATAVVVAAQAMWLLVLWAFWVDRHRLRV